jgi:hypothetical protein
VPDAAASGATPVVWYKGSQMIGDTITVGLQQKSLRSIDVLGDAIAITKGPAAERFDQLAGRHILFDIVRDTIRQVRAERYASSIYFLYDSDAPKGMNRAASDTIRINFAGGQVATIKTLRATDGNYVPERLVAGRESSFRLQGFRLVERSGGLAGLNGAVPSTPNIPTVNPSVDQATDQER